MLFTDAEHSASKRFIFNTDGSYRKIDYDLGWHFSARPYVIESMDDIEILLNEIKGKRDIVFVRGELDMAWYAAIERNPLYRIRRRKNDKRDGIPVHIKEADRDHVMLDVDGYPLKPEHDLINHPADVVDDVIRDLLPPEFHDAECVWQLSSSAGIVPGIFKGHLFFRFDQPHSNAHLRKWQRYNCPAIDHHPFNAVQPHFICAPAIEGKPDPLPVRTGRRHGIHELVTLAPINEPDAKTRKTRHTHNAGRAATAGFYATSLEEALARLGDGDGLEGFHAPLLAAGMHYALRCQKGRVRDDDRFKATLREAIQDAPQRPERDVSPYLDDAYLDRSISGAFMLAEQSVQKEEDDSGESTLRDCTPIFLRDIDLNLDPIEWVYGKTLIRGMLTLFGGIGGVGKTSYVLKVLLSIALGRPLLELEDGEPEHIIYEPKGNIWYYSLEDPQDMLVRKLKAEMLAYNINPRQVWDKVAVRSGRDAPLIVAYMDKGEVRRENVQPIVDYLVENNIVVMGIDPFANSFEGADAENQSGIMKIILDQWRIIAHKANCAIWLIHHFKKGGLAGDADAFRGSSTIQNAARVMETLTAMTIEQARELGIPEVERHGYVRLENAKVNLSATPAEGQWFKFEGVPLGNRTEKYPNGDVMGVLRRWQPPAAQDLTMEQANRILDRIDQGDPNGMFFTSAKQGEYWAGTPIIAIGGFTEAGAKKQLKQWLDLGLLRKDIYKHPKNGKDTEKLVVIQAVRDVVIA